LEPEALVCDLSVFDPEQYSCSMRFTSTAFFPAVQQVADQIFVQAMLAAKFGNAFTLAIKKRAGLLGGL
jgi:hypothetical protein